MIPDAAGQGAKVPCPGLARKAEIGIAVSGKNGYIIAAVSNAPVAQLDRAFDYESKGRTFESCRAHLKTKDLQIPLKSPNPKKVT